MYKEKILRCLDFIYKIVVLFSIIAILFFFKYPDFAISSLSVNFVHGIILLVCIIFMIKKIFFNIPAETVQLNLWTFRKISFLNLGVLFGFLFMLDFSDASASASIFEMISGALFLPVVLFLIVTVFDLMSFDIIQIRKREGIINRWVKKLEKIRFFRPRSNDIPSSLSIMRLFLHCMDTMLVLNIVFLFPKLKPYLVSGASVITILVFSVMVIVMISYIRDYTLAFGMRNYKIQKILSEAFKK